MGSLSSQTSLNETKEEVDVDQAQQYGVTQHNKVQATKKGS